jgi:hypothetical protein
MATSFDPCDGMLDPGAFVTNYRHSAWISGLAPNPATRRAILPMGEIHARYPGH